MCIFLPIKLYEMEAGCTMSQSHTKAVHNVKQLLTVAGQLNRTVVELLARKEQIMVKALCNQGILQKVSAGLCKDI